MSFSGPTGSNVYQFVPFSSAEVHLPEELSALECEAFTVYENALIGRNIYKGDHLVVHRGALLSSGCFVVVRHKEGGYLTRILYVEDGGRFFFTAAHPDYPSVRYNPAVHEIIGPAVSICSCERRNVCVDLRRQLVPPEAAYTWEANPYGGITKMGEWFADVAGVTPAQTLDWGFLAYIHPDDSRAFMERWAKSLREIKIFDNTARLLKAAGGFTWIAETGIPYFNVKGQVACWRGYGINLDAIPAVAAPAPSALPAVQAS